MQVMCIWLTTYDATYGKGATFTVGTWKYMKLNTKIISYSEVALHLQYHQRVHAWHPDDILRQGESDSVSDDDSEDINIALGDEYYSDALSH